VVVRDWLLAGLAITLGAVWIALLLNPPPIPPARPVGGGVPGTEHPVAVKTERLERPAWDSFEGQLALSPGMFSPDPLTVQAPSK